MAEGSFLGGQWCKLWCSGGMQLQKAQGPGLQVRVGQGEEKG